MRLNHVVVTTSVLEIEARRVVCPLLHEHRARVPCTCFGAVGTLGSTNVESKTHEETREDKPSGIRASYTRYCVNHVRIYVNITRDFFS